MRKASLTNFCNVIFNLEILHYKRELTVSETRTKERTWKQQSQRPDVVTLMSRDFFSNWKQKVKWPTFLATKLLNYKFVSAPFLFWIANKLLFTILPLTIVQVKMFVCFWNSVCYNNSNMTLISRSYEPTKKYTS